MWDLEMKRSTLCSTRSWKPNTFLYSRYRFILTLLLFPRTYKVFRQVDLYNECPFWATNFLCEVAGGSCGICECDESDVSSPRHVVKMSLPPLTIEFPPPHPNRFHYHGEWRKRIMSILSLYVALLLSYCWYLILQSLFLLRNLIIVGLGLRRTFGHQKWRNQVTVLSLAYRVLTGVISFRFGLCRFSILPWEAHRVCEWVHPNMGGYLLRKLFSWYYSWTHVKGIVSVLA